MSDANGVGSGGLGGLTDEFRWQERAQAEADLAISVTGAVEAVEQVQGLPTRQPHGDGAGAEVERVPDRVATQVILFRRRWARCASRWSSLIPRNRRAMAWVAVTLRSAAASSSASSRSASGQHTFGSTGRGLLGGRRWVLSRDGGWGAAAVPFLRRVGDPTSGVTRAGGGLAIFPAADEAPDGLRFVPDGQGGDPTPQASPRTEAKCQPRSFAFAAANSSSERTP